MDWLQKLRDFLVTPPLVRWPSDEFQTRDEAMIKLIEAIMGSEHEWALFVSGQKKSGPSVSIIDDIISIGNGDLIDLATLARRAGKSSIADRLFVPPQATERNHMHALKNSTPNELAALVDLIFVHHYRLPRDYPLEGYAEW